ncbi:MAG: helix-turn-helix transcriptional regulator [Planctomycetota bacterium]|jgi:AraC-like DNA-binding protein
MLSQLRLHNSGYASLENMGFALQHFPRYENTPSRAVHGHDILEANLIVRGTARQVIGSEEHVCPPGSLGIVHYGQEHCLATDAEGVEVINLYLDPANHAFPFLPRGIAEVAGTLFPAAVFSGIPEGLVTFLQFDVPDVLTHLLLHGCEEQEAKRDGYEAVMESTLRLFLIACVRQVERSGLQTLTADRSRWHRLEPLRLRLEREYAVAHRLADLAEEAGMSEAHLCRRFKIYTGLSPFEYLAQCRVRAAMQELRGSNRKVMEIAMAVGFGDIGHFNRKFKAIVGSSPSAYRKRFLKG